MNSFHDDFSHLGPSQHFHAIGMLIVLYSLLETWLRDLLIRYLPSLSKEEVHSIFVSLNTTQRMNLIRSLSAQEVDENSRNGVVQVLKCFEICAENRNLVAHAWPTFSHDETDVTIHMVKPPNRKPGHLSNYYFDLKDLQRAARDCWDCGSMLHAMLKVPLGKEIGFSGELATPKKLSLRNRPRTRSSEAPQPKSGQG